MTAPPAPGWSALRAAAGDLLLGACCWSCGSPGRAVCADCRATLASYPLFAAQPLPQPAGFPTTFAAAPYDGVAGALIRAHKERQAWGARRVLAERLAHAVVGVLGTAAVGAATAVLLVPVPSARATVRARGDDATRALARSAAVILRGTGRAVRPAVVLSQARPVRDQAGLSADERGVNLRGALRARPDSFAAAPAVVVDDVTTTGWTLAEARRALEVAGYHVLGAATVAATVRRGWADEAGG